MNIFSDFENRQETLKARLFLACAFFCSFIFYYFMSTINPLYIDFLYGRYAIATFCLIGFILSFIEKNNNQWSMVFWRLSALSYIALYLYLLHINDWSVFHRWSFFVTAAIICASAVTWRDYLLFAIVSLSSPLVLGFLSPLPILEQVHFHSANLAVFLLIGISAQSNFRYKKEVTKLTNKLIEQSKMAALGEMAGGISHEINNPLAIIKASNEQLKRLPQGTQEDAEKFNHLSDKINRMVMRITKITSGLKEFAQDNAHQKIESHDLNEIIETGIHLCQRKFKNSEVEIIFSPLPEETLCLCRKNQIIQVIFNLCVNAVEATIHLAHPMISITVHIEDDFYHITVSDNGVGIHPDNASKIMEPFFTTKEIGKGLGLGLSGAHGFAKAHGGELSYEPTKNLTRFILKLPLRKTSATQQ